MRLAKFGGALPLVLMTGLIVAVGTYATVRQDAFLTSFNLNNLLLMTMPLALVSLGQTCALLVGGFDISVAALMTFCVVLASYTMTMQLESPKRNLRFVDLQPGDIKTNFNDAAMRTSMDNPRVAEAWQTVDRNMEAAPQPELVARRILKIIDREDPPPRVTVGDFFQSAVAPLIFRLLPQRIQLWGLRKYYGI